MILNSVQNGPLVWPTVVEEDGTTRTNKYEELLVAEKLQADCELKAINIVFQGLPPDVYAIVNYHKVTKEIRDRVKLFMQGTKLSLQEKKCKLYDEFDKFSFVKGETLYQVTVQQVQGRQGQSYAGTGYKGSIQPTINFELPLIRETRPPFKTAGLSCNKFNRGKDKVTLYWLKGQCTQPKRPRNAAWFKEKAMLAEAQDLDAYDSNCDDVSNAKAVLMANLSNYCSNIISEIKEKLALKQQIDSLEQNFSNQIKEKESLLQTFTIFKNESKEKESKYMDKEIDLEKKIKELDNIVYKVVSRSKMLTKQNDPMSKERKVNTTPINYVELNQLSEDFGKCFVPQQELSDEQGFWLQTSHPNTDQSALSPVKIEAPKELTKVSLVNASLKKLKYHLGQFDTVVKKQITPNAITEGEW
ncbi:hypothetical protein Tco_0024653 [Tanacetum coccineum]